MVLLRGRKRASGGTSTLNSGRSEAIRSVRSASRGDVAFITALLTSCVYVRRQTRHETPLFSETHARTSPDRDEYKAVWLLQNPLLSTRCHSGFVSDDIPRAGKENLMATAHVA